MKTEARVTLGHSDILMRPIGLGCMGMSQFYDGDADLAEATRTIQAAIDLRVAMLDTSDIYGAAGATFGLPTRGFGHNERLIAGAIRGRRDQVVLATKFGSLPSAEGTVALDGRPEYVRQACEASLRRLETDRIDRYYCHRIDPRVPIEDTVGAMAELVQGGKVRAIGLSEVDAGTLRRAAAAVHPISALQSEYSLWERRVESSVVPACRALGITLVPYSPLGRAMLTGHIAAGASFPAGDFRTTLPGFGVRTSSTTSGWSMRSAPSAMRGDSLPARSPWHGCSLSRSTSCPSPGPSASPTCGRTWPRPPFLSVRTTWRSWPPSSTRARSGANAMGQPQPRDADG